MRPIRSFLLLLCVVLSQARAVAATPAQADHRGAEFPLPTPFSSPGNITTGPDGNLWFTEYADRIGRISTGGVISEFALPTPGSWPIDIASGPDGNLWFTEILGHQIGRVTPQGEFTEYPFSSCNTPGGIAAGPDGNLWFTVNKLNHCESRDGADGDYTGFIWEVTTEGVFVTHAIPTTDGWPIDITAGPDGNLWFTENDGNKIGRITTAGLITEFLIPTSNSGPYGIAAGPDGNLWFTETFGNQVGRITTSGVVTEFPIPRPNSSPGVVNAGPDGNLWFTAGTNKIGRITTAGLVTLFFTPTVNSRPYGIAAGPDGNVWFTETFANKIGYVRPSTAVPASNWHVPLALG